MAYDILQCATRFVKTDYQCAGPVEYASGRKGTPSWPKYVDMSTKNTMYVRLLRMSWYFDSQCGTYSKWYISAA